MNDWRIPVLGALLVGIATLLWVIVGKESAYLVADIAHTSSLVAAHEVR